MTLFRTGVLVFAALPLIACGAGAAPATPGGSTHVPEARSVPDGVPSEPAEPKLVTPSEPVSACALTGHVSGARLAVEAGGAAFVEVLGGMGTLSLGADGAAFLDVHVGSRDAGPSTAEEASLNGFVSLASRTQAREGELFVYPAASMSFGGVFFPGPDSKLVVTAAKGDKIIVAPGPGIDPDVPGGTEVPDFTLADGAGTLEVPCRDVSLEPDPRGRFVEQMPPQLLPATPTIKEQTMWIASDDSIPILGAPNAAPGGFLHASTSPTPVSVLDRRGAVVRIRHHQVAGWVPQGVLYATSHEAAPHLHHQAVFGMLGLLDQGGPKSSSDGPAGRAVSCRESLPIVLDQPGSLAGSVSRYAVGSIPSGAVFHVGEANRDLVPLALDGTLLVPVGDASLAVRSSDLAARCASTEDEADVFASSVSAPAEGDRPGEMDPRPKVSLGTPHVSGGLPRIIIERIARQNTGRFLQCYVQGLARDPRLAGDVTVKFVIGKDGSVSEVAKPISNLADADVPNCLSSSFAGMSFPRPEGGTVTVAYPINFSPGF